MVWFGSGVLFRKSDVFIFEKMPFKVLFNILLDLPRMRSIWSVFSDPRLKSSSFGWFSASKMDQSFQIAQLDCCEPHPARKYFLLSMDPILEHHFWLDISLFSVFRIRITFHFSGFCVRDFDFSQSFTDFFRMIFWLFMTWLSSGAIFRKSDVNIFEKNSFKVLFILLDLPGMDSIWSVFFRPEIEIELVWVISGK